VRVPRHSVRPKALLATAVVVGVVASAALGVGLGSTSAGTGGSGAGAADTSRTATSPDPTRVAAAEGSGESVPSRLGGQRPKANRVPDKAFRTDLARTSLTTLRRALTQRRTTSVALTRAYLGRIASIDSAGAHLNAVRATNPRALAEARRADAERRSGRVRGPLHGIPVLVKDNIDVAGLPTTAGALALKDSVPASDAFVVSRLRAGGAVVLGKTNLTEFANFTTWGMPAGYSALGGQVVNPYDPGYTPSGSSSGSAVAAAAGLAPVTVGTETFGSILSPAVANSVVGVKPTVGLVSRRGILPIASSQDTAGPMARSVSDAATLLTALAGVDQQDRATTARGRVAGTDYTRALSRDALRGARIGLASAGAGTDVERRALDAAVETLRAQGAQVVETTVARDDLPAEVLTYEFKRDLNAYLDELPAKAPMHSLDDIVRFNSAHADEGAIDYGQDRLLAANDIDLSDTAVRMDYEADRERGTMLAGNRIDAALERDKLDAMLFLNSGSAHIGARAQYPSVAVPIGYEPDTHRPIGMTLLGTAYSEARLLALAYAYEQAARVWRPPSSFNRALNR
jgi:amidase